MRYLFLFVLFFYLNNAFAQKNVLFEFGDAKCLNSLIDGKSVDQPLRWIDVNTSSDTWEVNGDILVSTGNPIGVIRSEKMYQNFILQVEWRHLQQGGNSGVFVWCDALPDAESRLPNGVEVQMLELDWVNQNKKNGEVQPIAYVHGELFGAGTVTTVPDNPRGERSKSIENRCLGVGQWNKYTVVCIDGTIKLSVNGKYVNGVRLASNRKGYLCLEAEGAPIEFKNLHLIELDGGVISDQHIVKEILN
ncbi:3-keto-disaccharide hydrolase [Sphingobacterium rhinopitheci]|uniref:3-keto-disaccharide hydrolase n=1 Tax=Sphingobacterium rhinopitheci TaxID=2781960 RepID=UPI001F51F34D|nr:DUF1080 domain-containing protein [Sphingobacterium rhinopitheci]MCI0922399.1 DUF1080 domain-containing protein [Sphingobacterium rhinopitheci]